MLIVAGIIAKWVLVVAVVVVVLRQLGEIRATQEDIMAILDPIKEKIAELSGSVDTIIAMLKAAQADGNVTPEEVAEIVSLVDAEKVKLDEATKPAEPTP